MTKNPNDSIYINDILNAINSIETFVNGKSYYEFTKNNMMISAVIQKILVIGEASKQIPEPFRAKYPKIPWSAMSKARDKLIHSYSSVDN